MKKQVGEVKPVIYDDGALYTLDELVLKLTQSLESVSEDMRDKARFILNVECHGYDGADGSLDLNFCRLETDKEEAAREKIELAERKQAAKLKAKQDERDRKLYEKLKKKLNIVD